MGFGYRSFLTFKDINKSPPHANFQTDWFETVENSKIISDSGVRYNASKNSRPKIKQKKQFMLTVKEKWDLKYGFKAQIEPSDNWYYFFSCQKLWTGGRKNLCFCVPVKLFYYAARSDWLPFFFSIFFPTQNECSHMPKQPSPQRQFSPERTTSLGRRRSCRPFRPFYFQF